jgi:hypothetical protein
VSGHQSLHIFKHHNARLVFGHIAQYPIYDNPAALRIGEASAIPSDREGLARKASQQQVTRGRVVQELLRHNVHEAFGPGIFPAVSPDELSLKGPFFAPEHFDKLPRKPFQRPTLGHHASANASHPNW